ncbi:MAG: hydroxymethylglutaryl-CoA reductase, degradative [Ardenticatenales bacterium]
MSPNHGRARIVSRTPLRANAEGDAKPVTAAASPADGRSELERAIERRSSRLPGFHRLPAEARRSALARWLDLTAAETACLGGMAALPLERADAMIENAVGAFGLPLGIATNFQIDGRDVLVPMAVEEPSVVAAASFGALLARAGGGFATDADAPVMIGQIQVLDLPDGDLESAKVRVIEAHAALLDLAHRQSETLPRLGGGAKDLVVRTFPDTPVGPMLVLHLHYDVRDAMGANAVNTACEALAPLVEEITGGRVLLRILSNLATERLVRARCRVPAAALARDGLDGTTVARRIVEANALAVVDPWRAATHNKGILNGIDPVVIATGNDWRGAEAGAHAFAARDGRYQSLTDWRQDDAGDLHGALELPLAVGTVGGGTRSHPQAALGLRIIGAESSQDLARVIAAVGLAQNLSALRALVCEGIQDGHMALHARQVALAAGAAAHEAEAVATALVADGAVRVGRAVEVLAEMRLAGE